MKPSQVIGIIACLFLVLITAGCTDSSSNSPASQPVEQPTPVSTPAESSTTQNSVTPSGQNLTVHFLDVGQGNLVI